MANSIEIPSLVRQLSWAQASLDLCLDMERNHSDARFADLSEDHEIVYTFDESVFELFIGGFDEPPTSSEYGRIYRDHRRSVGIFSTREWRETPTISKEAERDRTALNRQSGILTSEWLFSGGLPAMKNRAIYMTEGHLKELRTRWVSLVEYFRKLARHHSIADKERTAIRALLNDRATLALDVDSSSSANEVGRYIRDQSEPLRSDLADFWNALSAKLIDDEDSTLHDFWRFAFSRRLASELANMRAIGPLAQLVRINTKIGGRLRIVEQAGIIDIPKTIPNSERQPFWRDKIDEEIQRRESLGIKVDRSASALANDARALALLQALANSAARRGDTRRYVLVTADSLVIDVYRYWHCYSALPFEPFIIRPIRHFAPLLNAASMTDRVGELPGGHERRDIFPSLKAAIDPFLLSLNLAAGKQSQQLIAKNEALHPSARTDDPFRWPREMFALRLKNVLQEYRAAAKLSTEEREQNLRKAVAHPRFFPGTHFERLAAADEELLRVSNLGRQIERSAIGFGFPPLGARFDALNLAADLLDKFSEQDDSSLTTYIQDMVDEFGSTNLDLRVRSLNIAKELSDLISTEDFDVLRPSRVPLALNIDFVEDGKTLSISGEASSMVQLAIKRLPPERLFRESRPFDLALHNGNLGMDGGFRLYALYSCIALRLGKWDLAHHYSAEALRRVTKSQPHNSAGIGELKYLLALSIRFRLGAGVMRDATAEDVSQEHYSQARHLLRELVDDGNRLATFSSARAAAELVALLIFGSVWSQARRSEPGNNFPQLEDRLYNKELPLAWELSKELKRASDIFHSHGPSGLDVLEQVRTNSAAIYCLARLAKHRDGKDASGSLSAILADDDMEEWLKGFQPVGTSRPVPSVACFYAHWYNLLQGDLAEAVQRFDLDLRIDNVAAALFETAFSR